VIRHGALGSVGFPTCVMNEVSSVQELRRSVRDAPAVYTEEIEQTFLLARVLYKAVLGLHYKRQEQKKSGQLAIF
jgi:hypothetical protein